MNSAASTPQWKRSSNLDLSGLEQRGKVLCSPQSLVDVFGYPNGLQTEKTSGIYIFENTTGHRYCLCDDRRQVSFDPSHPDAPTSGMFWQSECCGVFDFFGTLGVLPLPFLTWLLQTLDQHECTISRQTRSSQWMGAIGPNRTKYWGSFTFDLSPSLDKQFFPNASPDY